MLLPAVRSLYWETDRIDDAAAEHADRERDNGAAADMWTKLVAELLAKELDAQGFELIRRP
jgi:hypothetical protein